ncbi:MAG: cytochrome P450, partial [Actinomycetota bacterium]|nr:cytochrome P450 [Actinomycetota bacterium]
MSAAPTITSFDPMSREFIIDPQAAFQDLYREAPVFFYEPLNAYYVLPYEEVKHVIADDETFSSHAFQAMPVPPRLRDRIPEEWERVGRTIMGGQTINMDAPDHTWHRRAMQQAFTRRRVEGVKPLVGEVANELIDGLADQGSCDVMRDFASQVTLRVVTTMLALPPHMLEGFQAWIVNMFTLLAPIDLKPEDVSIPDDQLVTIYERVHGNYRTYENLLNERRANPGDDLASAMLELTDDEGNPRFTSDQVLTHLVGITTAGVDTSSNLIVNMVRYFTESPDQLQLVLDEPALWDNAVQEGIRRSAISTQLFRISTRESELCGVTIPAGATIVQSLAAANGD